MESGRWKKEVTVLIIVLENGGGPDGVGKGRHQYQLPMEIRFGRI